MWDVTAFLNMLQLKWLVVGYMVSLIYQELIEKLNKGELPKNEYLCMNEPSAPVARATDGASARMSQSSAPQPAKSRRTATWARSRVSDDGSSRYFHSSLDFSFTGSSILYITCICTELILCDP